MKTHELVTRLLTLPMDDEIEVRLRLGEKYQDIGIDKVFRSNDPEATRSNPHVVIEMDGDYAFQISFVP